MDSFSLPVGECGTAANLKALAVEVKKEKYYVLEVFGTMGVQGDSHMHAEGN